MNKVLKIKNLEFLMVIFVQGYIHFKNPSLDLIDKRHKVYIISFFQNNIKSINSI